MILEVAFELKRDALCLERQQKNIKLQSCSLQALVFSYTEIRHIEELGKSELGQKEYSLPSD